MAIDPQDFDYVFHNYNSIINSYSGKHNLNDFERKRLGDALLMEKLIYDSRHGGDYDD
jgi:hypothetical protein